MQIHIFDTEQAVASALAARLAAALRERPDLVLGLPTGRTPILLYQELRRLHAAGEVSFARAATFNLDEFVGVGAQHPGSFRQYMQRHLFAAIDLPPQRVHFLDGMAADLDAECRRFERDIAAAGGLDMQLLGVGGNGHIGFNEPADELSADTHRATLLPETRRDSADLFDGDAERVPPEALSMGMATILKAATVILIATGERKADPIARALHGPLTPQLPASFLQMHRRLEVYLDRAAASLLPVEERA